MKNSKIFLTPSTYKVGSLFGPFVHFISFHFIYSILHKTQDTCKYSLYKYIDKVNTITNTWAKDIMHMEVFCT